MVQRTLLSKENCNKYPEEVEVFAISLMRVMSTVTLNLNWLGAQAGLAEAPGIAGRGSHPKLDGVGVRSTPALSVPTPMSLPFQRPICSPGGVIQTAGSSSYTAGMGTAWRVSVRHENAKRCPGKG